MMKRRKLAMLLGTTAAAYPFIALGQRAGGVRKIGVLMAGSEGSAENLPRIAAFREALAQLGWRERDNVQVEYRWSMGKQELIEEYAKELVALAPDVILANSTPVVGAFKSLTTSIPVVFALVIDPVGLGYVKSFSRPGGNFTGFTFIDPELIGKWMGLLKDVVPALTQAAIVFNPGTGSFYAKFVQQIEAARRPGAIDILGLPVGTTGEMEAAIDRLAKRPGSGLMVGPDPFNQVRLKQIADLAAQDRLPVISVYRTVVEAGGLMMYGPDIADIFRRAASYVDRILRGANPQDLPVQQPNKFEFVINLKTAKAFGLSVPSTLLSSADEVIE